MSFVIWVIIAIAITVIRNLARGWFPKGGGFPKNPDWWNDTPLGPGGHRRWPGQQPMGERRPQRDDKPVESGTPGNTITGRPGQSMKTGDESREPVAPTLQEPHETVHTTLDEPHETVHETVHVSTSVRPAPEYKNDKRSKPTAETDRVFTGESSYDRQGTYQPDRYSSKRPSFSMKKEDLVRAVVMAEVLGPPRARNPRKMKDNRGNR